MGSRIGAWAIDEFLIPALLGAISYGTLGILYFVLQDVFNGQSVGRRIVGQKLVDNGTSKAADTGSSVGRNVLALITYILLIGYIIDLLLIIVRDDGRKTADLLAGTRVVDVQG